MPLPTRGSDPGVRELRDAVALLTVKVEELTRKDWDVHVHERGRGRHRQVLDMLGQLT